MKNVTGRIVFSVLTVFLLAFASCDPSSGGGSTDTPPSGGGTSGGGWPPSPPGGGTGGGGWPPSGGGGGGGGTPGPGIGHTHSGTWLAGSTILLTDTTGFNVAQTRTCSCGHVDNRTLPLDVFLDAQSAGTLSFNVQMDLGNMIPPASGNWLALLDYLAGAPVGVYANLDLSLSSMAPAVFNPDRDHAAGKDRVRRLYLPNAASSITTVITGNPTFQHFTNLNFVRGDGITEIGTNVFQNLPLNEIHFGQATVIRANAFWVVPSLTTIHLPLVQTIEGSAFDTTNITGILDLPAVQTIGDFAFLGNANLHTVNLPAVQTIGQGAFGNAASLSTVNFGNSLQSIGVQAFANNTLFTSIDLPASFNSLGAFAFYNTNLDTIISRNSTAPTAPANALFTTGNVVLPTLLPINGGEIRIPVGSTGAYMLEAGWAAAVVGGAFIEDPSL